MRRFVVLLLCCVPLSACVSSGSTGSGSAAASSTTTATAEVTTAVAVGASSFTVDSLGLAFALPASFRQVEDPSYQFLAKSLSPRSVFSIDPDSGAVTQHEARPGESLTKVDIGGPTAVVVTNAALKGIPTGVSANELLVSNGDRSFSVIMSAPTTDIAALWDVFVRSVRVAQTK
jgi:hypothetical protein